MSNTLKYIVIAMAVIIGGVIAAIVYRMWFQFNQEEIKIYARERSQKYGANATEVYNIIMDGVDFILGSHNLTQQVLRSARGTNTDKEQELVNAAVNLCISFNYLQRP